MTIFEFLALLMVIAGLAWGIQAAMDQGLWAALLGGLLGAGKGYLVWIAFMFSILIVLAIGLRYRPPFPGCKKGRCKDEHFLYLYLDSEPTGPHKELERKYDGKLVRCRCGDLYLKSSRDRKFYEVRDDGVVAPFMRYRFGGRWRMDEAEKAFEA